MSAEPDLEDKIKNPPTKTPAAKIEIAAIKLKFLGKANKAKNEN